MDHSRQNGSVGDTVIVGGQSSFDGPLVGLPRQQVSGNVEKSWCMLPVDAGASQHFIISAGVSAVAHYGWLVRQHKQKHRSTF